MELQLHFIKFDFMTGCQEIKFTILQDAITTISFRNFDPYDEGPRN